MINPILEIQKQSRLFNEPPQPKTSIRDQFELIEDSVTMIAAEMRRLENRIVLLRESISDALTTASKNPKQRDAIDRQEGK